MAERRIEYMPLATIQGALRNPKRHDVAGIAASIDRYGVAEVPLIDERTGRLVAGHGRINDLTARQTEGQDPPDGIHLDDAGAWLVPVIHGWASRSDAEAEAYLVASNRLSEKGGWDHTELTALLAELADLDPDLAALTGYDAGAVDDMVKATQPPDLDALADALGDPDPSDTWPTIRVRVPHHIAAGWREHLDTHGGNDLAAFAALLELDPHWDGE